MAIACAVLQVEWRLVMGFYLFPPENLKSISTLYSVKLIHLECYKCNGMSHGKYKCFNRSRQETDVSFSNIQFWLIEMSFGGMAEKGLCEDFIHYIHPL